MENEITKYQRGHAWLYPEHPFNFNGFVNIEVPFSETAPRVNRTINNMFRDNSPEDKFRILLPKLVWKNDDVTRTSEPYTRRVNQTISQSEILSLSHEGIVIPLSFSTTDGNGKTTTALGPSSISPYRIFCSLWDDIRVQKEWRVSTFFLTYNGITFTVSVRGSYVGGRGKWGRSKTRRLRGYQIRCTTSDPFYANARIAMMYQRNNHPADCFNIYTEKGVPCNGVWYNIAGHDLYSRPLLIIQNRPTW